MILEVRPIDNDPTIQIPLPGGQWWEITYDCGHTIKTARNTGDVPKKGEADACFCTWRLSMDPGTTP
jgi:hypothetical protein